MTASIISAQIILLVMTSPLLLLLAVTMLAHRPMVNFNLWKALTGFVAVLSLVSLRDAYLLNEAQVASWPGFGLRVTFFLSVCVCLWFAWTEHRDA